MSWLSNHARATANNVDAFFRDVEKAKFSSNTKRDKLGVFQYHLNNANGGVEVDKRDVHNFLKHFYYLGYNLGEEEGVVLSLINSHISQYEPKSSRLVWSRILEFTQNRNHHAGLITRTDLPDDLKDIFRAPFITRIPEMLTMPQLIERTDWTYHPDATYLALANFVGAWLETYETDIEVLTQVLGINYNTWRHKTREILHHPDSPLSFKNGKWVISNRSELWSSLGSRIFDQDLDTFKKLAIFVLKEPDPSFELPVEERYAASIHGKVLNHSPTLRKGISEGLAILGSNPGVCTNCSQGKIESTAVLAIREIFTNGDWVLWGSLNNLLPTLVEAAPNEFLDVVEKALRSAPCPFDRLFAQEGKGITGDNYLTGLLWALEGLAWDEKYLVRVCVVLGELASHDPGGQWANRPSNSLATILLPWLPQTLASIEKRKVAVQTLNKEWPDIGWKLIIRLLPGQHQTSSGSHKPTWRNPIPNDREKGVSPEEYWEQVSFYAELAVCAAGHDTVKLSELIDRFDKLPKAAFNQLIEILSAPEISGLREKYRLLVWDHLAKFANKHRRFSDAKWALPDEAITRIENVADKLAPSNPFNLYQHLFSDRDFDLYDENGNWEQQRKKLDKRRAVAIEEILQKGGIESVIRFAESIC